MKKFIINLVIYLISLTVMVGLVAALVFRVCAPQFAGSFQAAFVDKMDRLMSIDEPKIILVGNSNLAYGMDSERLSKEMGMPVVNLGLHGDLGNAFHEEMARMNIGQGDLVIVCHSDYDDSDSIVDPAIAWITLENHYDYWSVIRTKDISGMVKALPKYLSRVISLYMTRTGNRETDDAYRRSAFNEYGDNAYPRKKLECPDEVFMNPKEPKFSEECVDRLNDLNEYCDQQGATLLVAGWPIADGDYNFSKSVYGDFCEALADELDCTVISDFKDYCFDYYFFYDSALHLNEDGVKARTTQLIEDLKRYMGGGEGEACGGIRPRLHGAG